MFKQNGIVIPMGKYIVLNLLLLGVLVLSPWPFAAESADNRGQPFKAAKSGSAAPVPEYAPMPEPGKKVPIGGGYYLIYGFDKKPKLGIAIMKVEIFDREGRENTSFEVKAYADMPSMKGAHMTVDRSFKLSRKGVYLAPLDIVMPGAWEIKLTVFKDGKALFRGSYKFDV